ncbi:Failed axon connections fax protein/glutathione s-transferase-like protein [Balamuthia mandrillaris]
MLSSSAGEVSGRAGDSGPYLVPVEEGCVVEDNRKKEEELASSERLKALLRKKEAEEELLHIVHKPIMNQVHELLACLEDMDIEEEPLLSLPKASALTKLAGCVEYYVTVLAASLQVYFSQCQTARPRLQGMLEEEGLNGVMTAEEELEFRKENQLWEELNQGLSLYRLKVLAFQEAHCSVASATSSSHLLSPLVENRGERQRRSRGASLPPLALFTSSSPIDRKSTNSSPTSPRDKQKKKKKSSSLRGRPGSFVPPPFKRRASYGSNVTAAVNSQSSPAPSPHSSSSSLTSPSLSPSSSAASFTQHAQPTKVITDRRKKKERRKSFHAWRSQSSSGVDSMLSSSSGRVVLGSATPPPTFASSEKMMRSASGAALNTHSRRKNSSISSSNETPSKKEKKRQEKRAKEEKKKREKEEKKSKRKLSRSSSGKYNKPLQNISV